MISCLPFLALVVMFTPVFVMSQLDYAKFCRESKREVNNMTIPNTATDLSVESREDEYVHAIATELPSVDSDDLTPQEVASLNAWVEAVTEEELEREDDA